jgi:hypothetical protein
MLDAGQAIMDKLLRDIRQTVTTALLHLFWRETLPFPKLGKHLIRAIGGASGELGMFVALVGSAGRVWSVPIDSCKRQRCAVLVRRVAAAMMNRYRMLARKLVKIVYIQPAVVLYFCVVKEMSFNPKSRPCFLRLRAEFFDDAVDRDKFDLEGLPMMTS